MKNNFKNTPGTKYVAKILLAVLLSTAAINSKAQDPVETLVADSTVGIFYTGMDENMMSLLLQFSNAHQDRYSVAVNDDRKNNLHMEVYHGLYYSRPFKVPTHDGPVTFVITNLRTKKKTIFQTKKVVHSYADVAIRRIK